MRSMSIKDGIKVECNAKRNKSVEEGEKNYIMPRQRHHSTFDK